MRSDERVIVIFLNSFCSKIVSARNVKTSRFKNMKWSMYSDYHILLLKKDPASSRLNGSDAGQFMNKTHNHNQCITFMLAVFLTTT